MVVLADTLKALSDDHSLEVFKSTSPSSSASPLQVRTTAMVQLTEALAAIRAAKASADNEDRHDLEFIAFALAGKQTGNGFGKVTKPIDAIVAPPKHEHKDDVDHKKEHHAMQFDTSDDKK